MELPVSNQTSNFGTKPHIKKGYYPAKFIEVKEFEQDNKLKECKYGNQIIMEFAIYQPDENGKPAKPVTHTVETEGQAAQTKDVMLPKFVYHIYKDQKTGEPRTAVTPNSAITKIFQSLGWEFNADQPLRPKEFLGKWCEVNIDDYEKPVEGGDPVKMSSIKDISKYDGPEVDLKLDKATSDKAEAAKPQKVKKELKHEDITAKTNDAAPAPPEAPPTKPDAPPANPTKTDEILAVNDRMANLKKLQEDGTLTKEGYAQGMEQLNKQLAELQK